MATCHAYCITSARDEVPDQYKGTAALIARCPELLVTLDLGSWLRPCRCCRLHSSRRSCGQSVGRQCGGRGRACGGDAAFPQQEHSQTDRSLRTQRGVDREVFKGRNAQGRTIGIIGLGEVGRRVARICGKGLEMRVLAYDPYHEAADFRERGAASSDPRRAARPIRLHHHSLPVATPKPRA